MIPELESLKLYIELLIDNCDYRDAESIIWYSKFITMINEHHAMLIEEKLRHENISQP